MHNKQNFGIELTMRKIFKISLVSVSVISCAITNLLASQDSQVFLVDTFKEKEENQNKHRKQTNKEVIEPCQHLTSEKSENSSHKKADTSATSQEEGPSTSQQLADQLECHVKSADLKRFNMLRSLIETSSLSETPAKSVTGLICILVKGQDSILKDQFSQYILKNLAKMCSFKDFNSLSAAAIIASLSKLSLDNQNIRERVRLFFENNISDIKVTFVNTLKDSDKETPINLVAHAKHIGIPLPGALESRYIEELSKEFQYGNRSYTGFSDYLIQCNIIDAFNIEDSRKEILYNLLIQGLNTHRVDRLLKPDVEAIFRKTLTPCFSGKYLQRFNEEFILPKQKVSSSTSTSDSEAASPTSTSEPDFSSITKFHQLLSKAERINLKDLLSNFEKIFARSNNVINGLGCFLLLAKVDQLTKNLSNLNTAKTYFSIHTDFAHTIADKLFSDMAEIKLTNPAFLMLLKVLDKLAFPRKDKWVEAFLQRFADPSFDLINVNNALLLSISLDCLNPQKIPAPISDKIERTLKHAKYEGHHRNVDFMDEIISLNQPLGPLASKCSAALQLIHSKALIDITEQLELVEQEKADFQNKLMQQEEDHLAYNAQTKEKEGRFYQQIQYLNQYVAKLQLHIVTREADMREVLKRATEDNNSLVTKLREQEDLLKAQKETQSESTTLKAKISEIKKLNTDLEQKLEQNTITINRLAQEKKDLRRVLSQRNTAEKQKITALETQANAMKEKHEQEVKTQQGKTTVLEKQVKTMQEEHEQEVRTLKEQLQIATAGAHFQQTLQQRVAQLQTQVEQAQYNSKYFQEQHALAHQQLMQTREQLMQTQVNSDQLLNKQDQAIISYPSEQYGTCFSSIGELKTDKICLEELLCEHPDLKEEFEKIKARHTQAKKQ
jgi:hypothetical protein